MIAIVRRKFGITVNDVFFAEEPASIKKKGMILFFVQAQRPHPGCRPFQTLVSDLCRSREAIEAGISKSALYKIKRAEREGFVPAVSTSPSPADIERFQNYYGIFARQRAIPAGNLKKLMALKEAQALSLTSVRLGSTGGAVAAAHALITDQSSGRVRLLYSASHFRGALSSSERNAVGRANRLLHWWEILHFKQLGYQWYDFGGLNLTDPAVAAVARFKMEFGGRRITEYTGLTAASPIGRLLVPAARAIKP